MSNLFNVLLEFSQNKNRLEREQQKILEELEKILEKVENSPVNVYKAELKQHVEELDERKNLPKSILNDDRIKYLEKHVEYLQQQYDSMLSAGNYVSGESLLKKLKLEQ